ncbi:MAG: dockerin type I repeat-containing protein [Ruminococcus sp.]|nr:dockerin type I repeat-containing protein [Ruminococcus sp.]
MKKFKKLSAMVLSLATVMSLSVNALPVMASDFTDELRNADIYDEDGILDDDKLNDYIEDSYKEENSGDVIHLHENLKIFVYDKANNAYIYNSKYCNKECTDKDGNIYYTTFEPSDFVFTDFGVQLTLAETNKDGDEIIEKVISWNTADEPIKSIELNCDIKPGESKYFQIFIDDMPEDYLSDFNDWKLDPHCSCFAPLLELNEERQAFNDFQEKRYPGYKMVQELYVPIYNYKKYGYFMSGNYDLSSMFPDTKYDDSVNTGLLETTPVTTSENDNASLADDTTTTTTITDVPFDSMQLPEPTLSGDADCDGKVNINDAVFVMQYIANPDKYQLSEQGKVNADIDGNGLTLGDAVTIQEMAASHLYD